MAYLALKPVRFAKNYAIGDTIPDNEVDHARAKWLIDQKIIAKFSGNATLGNENDPNSSEKSQGDKLPPEGEKGDTGENKPVSDDTGENANRNANAEGENQPPADEAGGETPKKHKK